MNANKFVWVLLVTLFFISNVICQFKNKEGEILLRRLARSPRGGGFGGGHGGFGGGHGGFGGGYGGFGGGRGGFGGRGGPGRGGFGGRGGRLGGFAGIGGGGFVIPPYYRRRGPGYFF